MAVWFLYFATVVMLNDGVQYYMYLWSRRKESAQV